MSRDAFKWSDSVEKTQPTYVPSSTSIELTLAEEVVDSFLEKRDWQEIHHFEIERDLASRLTSLAEGAEQLFMDYVVDQVVVNLRGRANALHGEHITYLLDPLLAAFYSEGRNHLRMDLRDFSMMSTLGNNLEGTKESPLAVSYNIPEREAIRSSFSIGTLSEYCMFDVKGTGLLWSVGFTAKNCEFYLPHEGVQPGHQATDCSFYIQNPTNDLSRFGKRFFGGGNRLFIPDGEGDWREVELDE